MMLKIIAEAKKYRLSNGQIIIVKKLSIRQFYLLVTSLIIYKKSISKVIKLKDKTKIKDYIEYMKENTLDIAIASVEEKNLLKYINESIESKKKIDIKQMVETLGLVIDFNSLKLSVGGSEIDNIDTINEELEIKLGLLSMILGKTPNEILNYPNYDMTVLYREYNRNRINNINDSRVAQHSEGSTYTKYTRALMGEVVYTGEDIAKDPGILKKELH